MATTSSTAGTGADDSSVGGVAAWTSPSSATGAANGTTSTSAADGAEAGDSNRLKLTNFSFDSALTTAASIQGITVVIRKKRLSGQNTKDLYVYLMKSNATTGSNKGDTSTNWATSLTDYTYGGGSDLWGTTWSGSDFTSTFGVAIGANLQTADAIAYIDSVTITVTYTAGAGDVWIQDTSTRSAASQIQVTHKIQIVGY